MKLFLREVWLGYSFAVHLISSQLKLGALINVYILLHFKRYFCFEK